MKEVLLDKLPLDNKVATVFLWHVEEGDEVEEGKNLVRLSINGKNFVISSPVSGIVSEICFDESEEVRVGDVLALIEENVKKENQEEEVEDSF